MKPLMILDNHFRGRHELFRPETYAALGQLCEIVGGGDAPMPRGEIEALLPRASFYVASRPVLSAEELARAPHLKAVIEVSGAFHAGPDYGACFARGVEMLSCAPGFRNAVAEMALAMMLAGGRGLVAEHEAFRAGREAWLDDREATDFTLFGQSIGFIGYGQIARQTHALLAPFAPRVMAYDPYVRAAPGVEMTELETLVGSCRVVVVAAVPSEETRHLLSADLIAKLQPGALVLLISRAWCADVPALMDAAGAGKIQLAIDVFPDEPLAPDDPWRGLPNVILSPHRAAAVPGGRQLIGEMILADVQAMLDGRPERQLNRAQPEQVAGLVAAQSQMNAMPGT